MSVVVNCASHSITGPRSPRGEVLQVGGPVAQPLRVGVEHDLRVEGVALPVDEAESAVEAAVLEHPDAAVLLQLLQRVLALADAVVDEFLQRVEPGLLGRVDVGLAARVVCRSAGSASAAARARRSASVLSRLSIGSITDETSSA